MQKTSLLVQTAAWHEHMSQEYAHFVVRAFIGLTTAPVLTSSSSPSWFSFALVFFSCSGSCFCMFLWCPFDFPLLIVTFLTTSWHLSAVRGKDQKLWCWLGLKRFGAAWRRCALHFATLWSDITVLFSAEMTQRKWSFFFSGVGANSSLFNSGLSRYPNTHLTSTSRCDVAPAQGTGQRAMMAQVGLLQTHQGFRGSQAALVSWRMVEMNWDVRMWVRKWIWLTEYDYYLHV